MKDKKKKNIKNSLILLLLIVLVVFIYVNYNYKLYKKGKESVFDKIPGMSPYAVKQAEKEMYRDGQQVKIDDYTITLEEVVYSREKSCGWCKFSVKGEGHNMEEETGRKDLTMSINPFGENRRMRIETAADAVGTCTLETKTWYRVEEDVMYVYYYIGVSNSGIFNHCVYLYDAVSGKGTGDSFTTQMVEDMQGIFELRENTDIKKYEYLTKDHTYEVAVSPYTINIRGEGNPEIRDIKIHFQNGNVLNVKENSIVNDDIKVFGEYIPDERGYIKTYSCILGFTEYMHIEEIDHIEINGEILER